MFLFKHLGRRASCLFSIFALFRSSLRWMTPSHIMGGHLLYSVYWYMWFSSRNTLTEIPRIMFDQMSRHPISPSGWHLQLTIAQNIFFYCFLSSYLLFIIMASYGQSFNILKQCAMITICQIEKKIITKHHFRRIY